LVFIVIRDGGKLVEMVEKCMPGSNTHGNGEYVTKHVRKLKEREVQVLGVESWVTSLRLISE
jgi:hypothetical protein